MSVTVIRLSFWTKALTRSSRCGLYTCKYGISVTVICLSFWTKALTHSTLSAIREVVGWPEQSSSVMLFLPLWNLFTHCYTFLCVIQFSPYCGNILLWILEGFYPLWPQKIKWQHKLNNGAIQNQSRHVYTMIAQASLNVMATAQHA
jgi:hypothetical protein